MALIGLDPGHGAGGDPGAVGSTGLQESVVTLETAWKARQKLVAMGYDVLFYGPELRGGMYQGDRAYHSLTQGAAAHISIHCNAADDPSAHGWEVWYNDLSDTTGKSLLLAQALEAMCGSLVTGDRGIKACSGNTRTQAVCRFQGPACIVEMAFLSNPQEEQMLASDGWRESMASAIARAIAQVFPSQPTSGFLHRAVFTPGSNVVSLDGRAIQMAVPMQIGSNGFSMIPLRVLKDIMAGVLTPQYAPDGSVIGVVWDF
jgi:N-acetylmuramoyl-L-alanine amidase